MSGYFDHPLSPLFVRKYANFSNHVIVNLPLTPQIRTRRLDYTHNFTINLERQCSGQFVTEHYQSVYRSCQISLTMFV